MASLRWPSWPEVTNLFTKDESQLSEAASARAFVHEAYKRTGGATADLKRVYQSFQENERRKKSSKHCLARRSESETDQNSENYLRGTVGTSQAG
jgi:hypothetical protein